MSPLTVSLLVVFIVAAGLIAVGTTGFFTMSVPGSQESGDSSGDDSPSFRVSMGLGERESNVKGGSSDDEPEEQETQDQEAEEEEPETIVTGLVSGGGGGGGGGSSSNNDDEPDDTPAEPPVIVPEADISVNPESTDVSVNDTFSVDIEIDTEGMVWALDLYVDYDKDVIIVTSVSEGNFLDSDGDEPVKLKYDNDAGEVEYINTRIAPQEGKSGSGKLITMEFEAVAEGSSTISISGAQIVDYDDNVLGTNLGEGTVTVNA